MYPTRELFYSEELLLLLVSPIILDTKFPYSREVSNVQKSPASKFSCSKELFCSLKVSCLTKLSCSQGEGFLCPEEMSDLKNKGNSKTKGDPE